MPSVRRHRRARQRGLWQLGVWNPRDYATDNHRHGRRSAVRRRPGNGDVARPLAQAVGAARSAQQAAGVARSRTLHLTPAGAPLTQCARCGVGRAADAGYVVIAGRYEGIDERLVAREVDEEIAIGEFVVSGGELPALMLIDAIARQLPGALKRRRIRCAGFRSSTDCSIIRTTRGRKYSKGRRSRRCCCPATMRRSRGGGALQALGRTRDRRPELWEARTLTKGRPAVVGRIRRSEGIKPRPRGCIRTRAGLGSRIGWRSAQQVLRPRLSDPPTSDPRNAHQGHPALRENGPPGTQICGDTHAHHRNAGAGRNCAPEQDDSRIRAGRHR